MALNLHVASINEVERGIIDGSYQVGIIPAHRSSGSLVYAISSTSGCCCTAASHALFNARTRSSRGARCGYAFAGLGYHSPNMEVSHRAKLTRSATASDQESIATLISRGGISASCRSLCGKLRGEGADAARRAAALSLFMPVREPAAALARVRAALLFQECLEIAHAGHRAKA
ncbi:hypothetical protein BMMON2_53440 [Burkholderia mallei]